LPLQVIESRFFGRPAHSLVTMSTELSCIPCMVVTHTFSIPYNKYAKFGGLATNV
jgi:hypothetical protein